MIKKIIAIGIVCLFLFGGIGFINYSEVNGEDVTVMSATLPTGRSYTSAIWDGEHAYIFGGHSPLTEYDDILRYNTSSDTLTVMGGTLPTARDGTSSIWNGTYVFIFGGGNGASSFPSTPSGTRYNEIIRYDPKTDSVNTMSATLPREIYFTSAVWDGNNAYIFGGLYDNGGSYKMSDEIIRYNTSTDTITTMTAKLPVGRSSSSCFWDGIFINIFPGSASPNQILRYDPILDNITTMSAILPTPPLGEKLAMTSTIWDGSNAFIFGGINENTRFFYEIFRYNPSTDNITMMSFTLPSARHGTSAIWDGTNAYIFGGYTGSYLNQIVQYELPDRIAPPSPFNISAIPDTWTKTNSFIVNWTNSSDESGLKSGAWYKIGSPPINNSDGTWQDGKPITVSSFEGNQTIYLWLEDSLGNRDFNNNELTQLYLDTTPPESFTPSSNPSGWTSNNQPQITFSTIDLLSGMDHYEVEVDSGSFSTRNSPYTLPILTDGTHNIIVRAYDAVGNYRDANVEVQIDTTPPLTPGDVTASPDSWTNSNSFVINWTNPSETDTSGIKIGAWYKIGSPPTSNSDGTWQGSKPNTITSIEGEQTIYIWLEDNVGNVNYLNYGTVSIYLDITPPEIIHVPVTDGNTGEPIFINATINDNVEVLIATLFYRITGDANFTEVLMTHVGNNYSAEVPASDVTIVGIDYYISASDNVNTAFYPTTVPITLFISIIISELDNVPPIISHTPITNGTENISITISATITDNIGVTGATLFYRVKGASSWESVPMTQTVYVFSADIPASSVTPDNVEYYIWTTDNTFNVTHPIINPQSQPHEISITQVQDPGDPEPKEVKDDFLTSFWWLLLLLFIVLILIVFLLSRRREQEVGIGPIQEETSVVEPEESISDEIPEEGTQPEEQGQVIDQPESDSPEEEPTKARVELGTAPKPVPPLLQQDIPDDEIFDSIKKKFEEGKISSETFEDFKKRYKKE